jgi:hypothetical protein
MLNSLSDDRVNGPRTASNCGICFNTSATTRSLAVAVVHNTGTPAGNDRSTRTIRR